MATFAKRSFDAAAYAAARPSYPPALFTHILAHAGHAQGTQPATLLDLGCGPGVSTFDWLPLDRFHRIIGTDPSQGMVTAARGILEDRRVKGEVPAAVDVRFEVARADNLAGVVDDDSVDLAVAGQAAHWFDAPATFRELARVLKPGGAFAFWGYGEFFFPERPELSALIPGYSAGTLGPYWEQPGRSIVEALLTPIPFPVPSASSSSAPDDALSSFDPSSFTRSFFLRPGDTVSVPSAFPPSPDPPLPTAPGASAAYRLAPSALATSPALAATTTLERTLLLRRQWTREQLAAYLRTWSAAHSFNTAHSASPPSPAASSASSTPQRTHAQAAASSVMKVREGEARQRGLGQRESDQGGDDVDCVATFLEQLERAGLKLGEGETVEVAWEMGVMMGRKKDRA
ncbi:class I SAM-dependent methyltransferase [Rhodotorula paludigena]|uniref:class I SAM-dependent methyltransferase n=1 Tax=Rhodotorula paludigena TaxID=86838 RepID=UPI0031810BD2